MLLGAAMEAESLGENTFMVYTGAPQNSRRKAIENFEIAPAKAFMKEHQIAPLIEHAAYLINLANNKDEEKYQFMIQFLRDEIARADAMGATQISLHPGSHVGLGVDVGIQNIITGLNEAMSHDQKACIALETMAGKGTEIGSRFEELARIIDGCRYPEKVTVTMDTCHINDAGYDVKNHFDEVLTQFNHLIGLDKLKVIHLNDSKNPQGSHKDRHENIGFGTIGFEALHYVATHPLLKEVPKILETPYVNRGTKNAVPAYGVEIAMLKAGKFDPDTLQKLRVAD